MPSFLVPNLEVVSVVNVETQEQFSGRPLSLFPPANFSQPGISVFEDLFIQSDSDMRWYEPVFKMDCQPVTNLEMKGAAPYYPQMLNWKKQVTGFFTRWLQDPKFRSK